jgi:hypothetical protein
MTVGFKHPDTLHPRALVWVALSVLAALVVFFAFRGYVSPELLFNFANSFYC